MNYSGDQIKAGDVLANFIDGGRIGQVMELRPYRGPLGELLGTGTQIATLYGGMQITLPAVSHYRVERPAA